MSQILNKAQRNYTVTELECLAAVICVQRFRQYIEGLLMSQKDLNGRLTRWSLKLQHFDFVMEHRKGSLNVVPDTLSRLDVDALELSCNPPEVDIFAPEFNSPEHNELRNKIREGGEALPYLCLSDNYVFEHRIRQKYFWPHMVPDMKSYIDKCDDCKAIKPKNQILRPLMGNQF